ncbi:hypothetical protein [Nocardioides aquiterrae]|uniref:Transporter n=1 Tax=Nocardioides aquiterrae TaxID=203799 RepID=A0ABN1U836_9ACTN
MPPITVVFIASGLAVWLNALYFLGIGAKRAAADGPDPLVSVGWVSLAAGIVDLLSATYILAARPAPLGDAAVVLAGLVVFYGMFFIALGVTEVKGLDLRPIGNLAVAVAIVPLFWWKFFEGGWMFRSILVVWLVAFFAIAATTYGKFKASGLGVVLLVTAAYTFFAPVAILALGRTIP